MPALRCSGLELEIEVKLDYLGALGSGQSPVIEVEVSPLADWPELSTGHSVFASWCGEYEVAPCHERGSQGSGLEKKPALVADW